ncbi:MAG: hypothetical protein IKZ11_03715, partial [Alistipes sp.]|nr:hypothetical protein [Alistipes sp.]
MKRFLFYTIIGCVALALGSCSESEQLESYNSGGDYIRISTSMGAVKVTRAEDNAVERKVEHIDIFVVSKEGTTAGEVVHYERNTTPNDSASADGEGSLTLTVKRSNEKFLEDTKYAIYLVANSTISTAEATSIATFDELKDWTQSDALLHITGTQAGAGTPPQSFLMQAVAGAAEGQVINSSAGNGVSLDLQASFERVAAKVVVNIKQGEGVEFHKQLSYGEAMGNALYYFNMLPVKSYVLPGQSLVDVEQELVTTADLGPNNSTFVWSEAAGHTADAPNYNITLVGYAYAHNWSEADPLNETCLIVNIPIKWDKDGDTSNGKEVVACNSWYMIPLSQHELFERNTCYVVNVTINTGGASDRTSVVELDGVEYQTLPWREVGINVGATSND